MHNVDDQFDRRANGDGTAEHGVRRTHRLVRKSLRHSDNRLGDHLGTVGMHVEQCEQAVHRPPGLI